MDRRKFIKGVAAASVVVAVPFSLSKPTYTIQWSDGASSTFEIPHYGPSIVSLPHVQKAQRELSKALRQLVDSGIFNE